jgi:hypothetical protein
LLERIVAVPDGFPRLYAFCYSCFWLAVSG